MPGRLWLDYCGEQHVLSPPGPVTFGRDADLVMDDNPYMHRVLGSFGHRGGRWELTNAGRSTVLNVSDHGGPSAAVLAPGRSVVLGMPEFSVTFVSGRTRYMLDGSLEGLEDREPVPDGAGEAEGGQRTLEWGVVELNPEQRDLLVDLAAGRLLDPHSPDWAPDPKAACARRLGWSLSKYNRKLDHLCQKLHRAGVPGLIGVEGAQAAQRRQLLVEHALAVGLVNRDDASGRAVARR